MCGPVGTGQLLAAPLGLQRVCRQNCQESTVPWIFASLASGLAPSATLGGERGGGTSFPDVFAICLKSLNGKEWQECRNFFVARLQHRASCLPRGSADISGNSVMGRCSPARVLSQKSDKLHALRMQLPLFSLLSWFHDHQPFPAPGFSSQCSPPQTTAHRGAIPLLFTVSPVLALFRGCAVPRQCNSSGLMAREIGY